MKSDWNNSLDTPWTLDSLDQDRDGKIDFKELDRDGNGELDAEECLYVGRTTITMIIVDQNILYTQSVAVHPRNHLIALSKKNGVLTQKLQEMRDFKRCFKPKNLVEKR